MSNKLQMKGMELKEKKNEEKKNKFNKLHPSVRNMIVVASAYTSDKAATDSGEVCKRFFKCETMDLANQELNFKFKSMGWHK
eukprot:580433-Ditylum_brightwellii.AAC.1